MVSQKKNPRSDYIWKLTLCKLVQGPDCKEQEDLLQQHSITAFLLRAMIMLQHYTLLNWDNRDICGHFGPLHKIPEVSDLFIVLEISKSVESNKQKEFSTALDHKEFKTDQTTF